MKAPEIGRNDDSRREVVFTLPAERGSRVSVAGSFNEWDPERDALTYDDDKKVYHGSVMLSPGTYQYKFVIDGLWSIDPNCPHWSTNEYGSLNSVVDVD